MTIRMSKQGKLFVATDEATGISAVGESTLVARSRLERHLGLGVDILEPDGVDLQPGELPKDLERGD